MMKMAFRISHTLLDFLKGMARLARIISVCVCVRVYTSGGTWLTLLVEICDKQ